MNQMVPSKVLAEFIKDSVPENLVRIDVARKSILFQYVGEWFIVIIQDGENSLVSGSEAGIKNFKDGFVNYIQQKAEYERSTDT